MSRAICPKCGCTDVNWIRDDADCAQYICLECKQDFCYPPKTVFDTITASHEVLAEKLVYEESLIKPDGTYICRYFSTIVAGGCWLNESDAIAATIEKLKEAADAINDYLEGDK